MKSVFENTKRREVLAHEICHVSTVPHSCYDLNPYEICQQRDGESAHSLACHRAKSIISNVPQTPYLNLEKIMLSIGLRLGLYWSGFARPECATS